MKTAMYPPCVHCRGRSGSKSRGLCAPCFENPKIRNSIPARNQKGAVLRPFCRNCNTNRAWGGHGLCRKCNSRLSVRQRFGIPMCRQRSTELAPIRPEDLEPTKAFPGSEEKIQVLAARFACGVPLWHPDDAGYHLRGWK